ncbi:transcription termination factor 1-like [Notolabrus celidotus]|uniref:transcription termination factor 1-like n=1 Tax=Notolabrus celidotus TaxID=1203425 RepID=UPI001490882A|nr:transcription termination factor 1-like [Notolabrus celidotus]
MKPPADSQQDDPVPLDVTTPARKEKRKKKHKIEEEEVSISSPPASDGDLSSGHKKKKKRKEQEEEEMQVEEVEEPVTEKRKKKKQKKTLSEDSVVTETDEHEGETDPGVSVEANSKKKKKKRREVIAAETTEEQNNTEMEPQLEEDHEEEEEGGEESVPSSISKRKTVKEKKKKVGKPKDRKGARVAVKGRGAVHKRQKERMSAAEDWIESSALDELQEYIPDIKKRSLREINRIIKFDLQRFRKFKEEGVPVRWGRFSEEENQQIRKNVSDFLALIGINSATKVMFPKMFSEEAEEIQKLRLQHRFVEKISEGIPRPCHQIHIRARKIYDEGNNKGRFSDEEVQTLIKLQNKHGNNWKMISEKMGRSVYSVEKRFAANAKGHGSWSHDEESRLKKALKDYLIVQVEQSPEGSALTRDQLCNNLPWAEISQKVKTRHWIQCRLKWFSLLKNKLGSGESTFNRRSEGLQAKIQLINTLYNMRVDDIADIDWDEVAKTIDKATPVCIQKSFRRLKVSRVPNWAYLSYGEIIDFLYSIVLPSLKEKLNEPCEEEEEEEKEERTYKLSDIFISEDEEQFEEVDNS